MSDLSNPFQSPEADTKIVKPLVSQGLLTDTMLKYLKEASPWLRFMGIMGFIGSGFMTLAGIILVVLLPFGINMIDDGSEFLSDLIGPFSLIGYSMYSIGAGLLLFIPSLFTYRFGKKIRSYFLSNSEAELELAFKNNKSLWKFYGLLTIIMSASLPILIIIGVIVAVAVFALF